MKYVLAVDLGATKVLAGILDQDLKVIKSRQAPTRDVIAGLADPNLAVTKRVISELLDYAKENDLVISAGGIGFPEYVAAGKLISRDCVAWESQPEIDLAELTNFPWRVESDVRCAALAEAKVGAGVAKSNFIYLTISSGISHALVIDGKPYAGAAGKAIGFGVTMLEHGGSQKTLEAVASGLGIAREFQSQSGEVVTSAIEVFDLIDTNPIASTVISTAAAYLAREIANIYEILDPGAIVIGGGLWLGAARYRELILKSLPTSVADLISSAEAQDSGLLGAGLVALVD